MIISLDESFTPLRRVRSVFSFDVTHVAQMVCLAGEDMRRPCQDIDAERCVRHSQTCESYGPYDPIRRRHVGLVG